MIKIFVITFCISFMSTMLYSQHYLAHPDDYWMKYYYNYSELQDIEEIRHLITFFKNNNIEKISRIYATGDKRIEAYSKKKNMFLVSEYGSDEADVYNMTYKLTNNLITTKTINDSINRHYYYNSFLKLDSIVDMHIRTKDILGKFLYEYSDKEELIKRTEMKGSVSTTDYVFHVTTDKGYDVFYINQQDTILKNTYDTLNRIQESVDYEVNRGYDYIYVNGKCVNIITKDTGGFVISMAYYLYNESGNISSLIREDKRSGNYEAHHMSYYKDNTIPKSSRSHYFFVKEQKIIERYLSKYLVERKKEIRISNWFILFPTQPDLYKCKSNQVPQSACFLH